MALAIPKRVYGQDIQTKSGKEKEKMVRKAKIKVVEGLKGGVGKLEMHHILEPEELNGHGRLYRTWQSLSAR